MRRLSAERSKLGECPTWDTRARRFRWIDVTAKKILSCDSDGGALESRLLEDYPGSFGIRDAGGVVIGFRRGVGVFDAAGNQLAYAGIPSETVADQRFNDGAVDAAGRFWVGTMDKSLQKPIGGLYRIDHDLTMHRMTDGVGLSNGIAWSPDNRLLYHCDSTPSRVFVHDFDLATGTVSNRRVFIAFDETMGKADGCAVDAEGFLWVAAARTGRILRFDLDGRLDCKVAVPTLYASSICFGDDDLKTMYITSLQPFEGAVDDNDGALFATRVEVPGLPTNLFVG
jgi:L-arabinonolactonase